MKYGRADLSATVLDAQDRFPELESDKRFKYQAGAHEKHIGALDRARNRQVETKELFDTMLRRRTRSVSG